MAIKLADVLLYLGTDQTGLDKGLNEAKGKTNSWAGNVANVATNALGNVVLGAATAAATAVVSIGTAAFDVSKQTEGAAASIAASLNIPREEAEAFADVAKRVYGNNFAGSVTEAGEAVMETTRLLKLAADDPALKTITEKALALKDSFDVEVNESVSAAKTLMENFGLSSDEAFDMIAKGYQKGLDRSGDFLDSVNEYSVQFSNGGATAQEFFGIMESGLQGGMLGTDKAADAFKEFRVRILDGSTTTADALTQIGLNAEDITAQIDSGSMTITDAWNLVIGKLKETEDQSILMQAGVGLIGTQFEDLGQEAVLAMSITSDAFADAGGAADALNKRYETLGDGVQAIWRRLVVSVSPLTDKLLDMANAAIPHLMAAFDRFDSDVLPGLLAFGATVSSVVSAVMGFFQQLGTAVDTNGTGRFAFLKDWVDTNLPLIRNLFETILGAIQRFWETNGQAIMTIVTNTFSTVFTIIDTALKTVLDLVTLVLQLLTGDFDGAAKTLLGIIDRLWETIKTIFGNALENVRALVLGIDWADLGMNMILGIANGIKGAASFMASAAVEAAQRAFDAAAEWLQLGSPSKRAEDELGEPTGEGFGIGLKKKIGAVAADVQVGLNSLFGSLAAPAPVASANAVGGGGPRMEITINNTFNGPADEAAVRRGTESGIVSAMRNLGLR